MRTSAVLLLGLAGCARPDASPPPQNTADSVSSPATTEAPAAAAPWVLSERGLGPVRIGMTVAEVRDALGDSVVFHDPVDANGADACRYGLSAGLPAGTALMFEGGRVVRIDVDSVSATSVGAHVGMSEAEALRLYPSARVEPHHYVAGHYLVVIPGAPGDTLHRIVLETDSTGVTTLRGGLYPPVQYVEGCS